MGLNSQGRWDAKGQNSPVKKSKLKVETNEKIVTMNVVLYCNLVAILKTT